MLHYGYGLPKDLIGLRFTDDEARALSLAVKAEKSVVSSDTLNDERLNREQMEKFGVRSLMTIPLIAKEEVVGALSFYYRSAPISFTDYQVDFSAKLAASLSLAIKNTRLYEIQRRIADTLQESLLIMPEHIEGIEFGYLYRSATEAARVGGDFYDIFELEHDKVGIVILNDVIHFTGGELSDDVALLTVSIK